MVAVIQKKRILNVFQLGLDPVSFGFLDWFFLSDSLSRLLGFLDSVSFGLDISKVDSAGRSLKAREHSILS